ncbi:MAG: PPC domain-containing protein [Verrucomicrobia bacterium]|nr:PPC domain-containing protein [Verrucomicrobiota bacterium]
MKIKAIVGIIVALTSVAAAQQFTPHIGYVYPAGGRQGTTFQVTLGGQFLDGVSNVFVSGTGVQTSVVDFTKPMPQGDFNRLRDKLRELQDKKQAAFKENRKGVQGSARVSTNVWSSADEKAIAEIRGKILKNPPNRQGTPAIAENVIVRVILATNAEPGEREIRLGTLAGLSNPLKFCIGSLTEFSAPPAKAANPDLDRFLERLGRTPIKTPARSELRITLPAIVNGQITPGAVDRFRFTARGGQHLVAVVSARELIPYLADAVPGWFQATLALYDAKGKELAYDDDYSFHPDPVLHYKIPKDGEYIIEIKDAIYRGREDFVYRIMLGELPFVTSIFPLGGKLGNETSVELRGWNLPTTSLTRTNTVPGIQLVSVCDDQRPLPTTQTSVRQISNPVPLAVDTLPECLQRETNNSPSTAQPVILPVIVNGRIDQSGETDVFRFEGRAGDQFVAEVYARRLDSPLDSLLKLTDATGRLLASNDDYADSASGLNTHHADSYLRVTLPTNGSYYVHLGDAQHHGGAEYAYRLRLSAPRPDFELRVVPSSINARAGVSVPLTVRALRKDGFSNEIGLALKNAPPGFTLSGGRVPANQDQVRVTLTAPSTPLLEPVNLALEGHAIINGEEIVRAAVPADDMMQAFAYRHLVPAKELLVAVSGRRAFNATARILDEGQLKIPVGGTARVQIAAPAIALADRFDLELNEPPEGITIQNISPGNGGAEIVLQSDAKKTKPGLAGNLIINVVPGKNLTGSGNGKNPGPQRRAAIGTLPAIPFEIVGQ